MSRRADYTILETLDRGGSDREFYRCRKGTETYIMVHDKNIQTYVSLQQHLASRGVPVPRLYWFDMREQVMVIEDLGNESLYFLANRGDDVSNLYRDAIQELVKLQVSGYPGAPVSSRYDYEQMRWEQEYFKEHFLATWCKVPEKTLATLGDDFESLASEFADKIEGWKDFLMHRDYQSQNLYVKEGKVRIIDFQSARFGPPSYDLASLLRDAYTSISENTEEELLTYFIQCLTKRGINVDPENFKNLYQLSCLQRNMQALGAFANLSLNKYKVHFKQFVPRGFELLQRGLTGSRFKELSNVVNTVSYNETV